MERDKIIKAFECCIGGRDDEDCAVCPYDKHKCNCVICLMTDALALIKELTEENERLRRENALLEMKHTDRGAWYP